MNSVSLTCGGLEVFIFNIVCLFVFFFIFATKFLTIILLCVVSCDKKKSWFLLLPFAPLASLITHGPELLLLFQLFLFVRFSVCSYELLSTIIKDEPTKSWIVGLQVLTVLNELIKTNLKFLPSRHNTVNNINLSYRGNSKGSFSEKQKTLTLYVVKWLDTCQWTMGFNIQNHSNRTHRASQYYYFYYYHCFYVKFEWHIFQCGKGK